MLEAYFDESGTDRESPILSVAGYLFDAESRRTCDHEWRVALEEDGIQGAFHMNKHKNRGPLVRRLVGIIKDHVTIGVAVAASEREVMEYIQQNRTLKRAIGNPYTMCVVYCVLAVGQWVVHHCSEDTTVSYFFERGHKDQGQALDYLNALERIPGFAQRYRYKMPVFAKKEELRPLQTADVIAWEWRRHYTELYNATGKPMRKSLESLLEKQHLALFFNRNNVAIEALSLLTKGFAP